MSLRSLVIAAVLTASWPLGASASAAPAAGRDTAADPADPLMKKMLDALKANRYDDFVADGTPKLKSLGKQSFALVSAHFAPLLLAGYKTTYLAKLDKPDLTISLWKLEPNGASSSSASATSKKKGAHEDFEIRLILKAGKVDSFSIQ